MYDGGDDEGVRKIHSSREQGFFDRSPGIRLLIGLLAGMCLFAFVHFREVRVEMLELRSIAQRYVVAQVDFQFLDEEATSILKKEAVRDVGKIYHLEGQEVSQQRVQFENYLTSSEEWRQKEEKTTFDDIQKTLNLLEATLLQIRFTDPRSIRKMDEIGYNTDVYQIFAPSDVNVAVALPSQIWRFIRSYSFSQASLEPETIKFVVDYFKGKQWLLQEDVATRSFISKQAQSSIADKYTKILAGSRIIDQGEKVTARHQAMIYAMKKSLRESRNLWYPLTVLGSVLITLLILTVTTIYFHLNHPDVLASNRKLFLLLTIVFLTLAISKIFEYFLLTSSTNFADSVRYPLFVPFAAMLICCLMNPNIAVYICSLLSVLLMLNLAIDRQGFLLTNFLVSFVVILSVSSMKKRKEIFIVASKGWFACAIAITSFYLYENEALKGEYLGDLGSSFLFMLITSVFVVGLLPLLESSFDIMTDASLMEYMDPNHPLLRRLTIEAPGTYQHSLVVGNLSEAAAIEIGANGLFCRVVCLYHDIGKLATPQYFTENQQGGMNIHQLLTPLESSQVIINHVTEGVAMGRKEGLPERFIDIIKEHHGTTLVYFFYCKQLEQHDKDASKVNQSDFRYAGPKPRAKESAIIMIADSFEAASRSLEEVTEESLMKLLNKLVSVKAEDGQFSECLLTFEELEVVKRAMVKTLLASGHSRIKYPEQQKAES
jgi:putative nucleotidyltransferase with HDIG domain